MYKMECIAPTYWALHTRRVFVSPLVTYARVREGLLYHMEVSPKPLPAAQNCAGPQRAAAGQKSTISGQLAGPVHQTGLRVTTCDIRMRS